MTHQEYVVDGVGAALVLLHGGLSNRDDFDLQLAELTARYRVWRPDRRGHGATPDVPGPITYDTMADDTIEFLESIVGEPAHLIGYSDGAMVGLLVALRRPDLVRKLVLMGLYVNRDGEVEWFGRFVRDATAADVPESLRRVYEERSPDGPEHFAVVAEKILHLWRTEPDLPVDALRDLAVPTLLLQGDEDIVTLEHGVAMARAIPDGQLAVVPGTSHTVPYEKPALVAQLFLDFLADDPPRRLFTAEALGV
jgi:pimeloyl-ACP methyl ester carboxylesterase